MKLLLTTVSLIMITSPALAIGQDRMWADETAFDETCMSTECCSISDMSAVPCLYSSSGWFAGVGGSFNSVKVESTTSGIGRTQIYSGPTLVAVGVAGGPAAPFEDTETTFAPLAQVGYMHDVRGSDWTWGAKFSYKYLGLTLSDDGFDAPQIGVYEILNPPSTSTFTGNAVTDSAQTLVNHELALFPFLGRSIGKGRFYAGGGPVVYSTESRLYGLSSYADINGTHTNIGGAPLNLASSNWMWGGGAQMGMLYHFSREFFLDVNYDFKVTGQYTQEWPQSVTSSSNGLTYDTNITYKEEVRLWAQSLNVTFNVKF